jgi:hypothetical protein
MCQSSAQGSLSIRLSLTEESRTKRATGSKSQNWAAFKSRGAQLRFASSKKRENRSRESRRGIKKVANPREREKMVRQKNMNIWLNSKSHVALSSEQ